MALCQLSPMGRVDRWDGLVTKPPIEPEITVDGEHVTVGEQLAHPDDAGVGQVHPLIPILVEQAPDWTDLLLQIEPDDEISVLQQPRNELRRTEVRRFDQGALARYERSAPLLQRGPRPGAL